LLWQAHFSLLTNSILWYRRCEAIRHRILFHALVLLFMPKDYSMAPFFATIDTAIMDAKLWTLV
jgi:hypothetical protein